MKIDLSLNEEVYEINGEFEISEEDIKNTDIKRISKIKVNGNVYKLDDGLFELNLNVTGVMILLCALSLEEVEYPFNININNTVEQENLNNLANTLDIFPIVWENIVLEIPSRIVKEDVNIKTSGNGWNLITDDEIKNMEEEK